jgi:hypothetical protein
MENYIISPHFVAIVSTARGLHQFLQQRSWALFWATFLQTLLVGHPGLKTQKIVLRIVLNYATFVLMKTYLILVCCQG